MQHALILVELVAAVAEGMVEDEDADEEWIATVRDSLECLRQCVGSLPNGTQALVSLLSSLDTPV